MNSAGIVLLLVLMVATALVLVVGITLMARGGEANRKYGNKLMTARVVLQAAAITVLMILLSMKK
jgi:hypothetical protein